MTSISAPVASGPSYFSQGEDSLPPHHQSVGELVNWFASEIHSLSAIIVVPTLAGNSKAPERHLGVLTTSATATIPFSGCAIPTRVILTLQAVPLHIGTGQYPPSLDLSSPPSLDRGGAIRPFPPPQPSEPSHLSVDYAMIESDTARDPRYSEYAPTPARGFPEAPRSPIPQPDERYGHQPPGYDDPMQGSIPHGATPAEVRSTASSGGVVYPPPFNPTPYLVSDHPLSSPLLNHGVIPPIRAGTTYPSDGNGHSTSQAGLACRDTPTILTTAGPIQGIGVDQHPDRHKNKCTMCRASYARPSELNRHVKDKHMAWMACHHCNAEFSSGRMYKFTQHLQKCTGT